GSADEILAYSFDPPARLIRLGVQGSSLPVVASSFEALQAFSSGIWVAGGRVYDTWGTAADVQSLSRTGLVNGGSFAAADHDEDIIIFLRVENSRWILYAYRASTSKP